MGHARNLPHASRRHASSHEGHGHQERGNLPLPHSARTKLHRRRITHSDGTRRGGQAEGDHDAGPRDDALPGGRAICEDAGAGAGEEGDSGTDGGRDFGADGSIAHHST